MPAESLFSIRILTLSITPEAGMFGQSIRSALTFTGVRSSVWWANLPVANPPWEKR